MTNTNTTTVAPTDTTVKRGPGRPRLYAEGSEEQKQAKRDAVKRSQDKRAAANAEALKKLEATLKRIKRTGGLPETSKKAVAAALELFPTIKL